MVCDDSLRSNDGDLKGLELGMKGYDDSFQVSLKGFLIHSLLEE